MAIEEEEVAVFVETNLGTRIVIAVPIDIIASDFKRKLEIAHTSLGDNIRVVSLMFKRRSCFYYIAESVPIKYIFRDNQKPPWFIHAEAAFVSLPGSQHHEAQEALHSSAFCNDIQRKTNNKTKKNKKHSLSKPDSVNLASAQTSLDKTESLHGPETVGSSLSMATPAVTKNSECFRRPKATERELGGSAVSISKRLIVAANNIRTQGKKSVSSSIASSVYKTIKRSLDAKRVTFLDKFAVFEIPYDSHED
ncbi:unnamed protein product [Cochlearia groenlandica]